MKAKPVLVAAALLAALLVPMITPQRAAAFCNEPGGDGRRADELCHNQMLETTMPFLRPEVLAELKQHVNAPDSREVFDDYFPDVPPAAVSDNHFDNCNFDGGVELINDRLLDDPSPGRPAGGVIFRMQIADIVGIPGTLGAMRLWAWVLHAAEDFYSHSNWTEMALERPADDLTTETIYDDGLGTWAEPAQEWKLVPGRDDMIASQDQFLPDGWEWAEDDLDRTPLVRTHDGEEFWLLISGEEFNVNQSCPLEAQISHDGDNGLRKDDSSRPYYDPAAQFALRQTAHEWCRLLHLAKNESSIWTAAAALGLLVQPGASPHPAGTPCAETPPGINEVSVEVTDIIVKNDKDDFDNPGDINLTFSLFNDDFTRSQVIGLPFQTLSNGEHVLPPALPSTGVCASASEDLYATVQGWDDDDEPTSRQDFDDDDGQLKGVTHFVGRPLDLVGAGAGVGTFDVDSDDLRATFKVTATPTDRDGDGLSRCHEELVTHTNPNDADSDNDGLDDGAEIDAGTNPLDADSDDDGLSDGSEVDGGSNPVDADSDDDGLDDADEVAAGTNPNDADSDDDGLDDGADTKPLDADSDDDGLLDGHDVEFVEATVTSLPTAAFRPPGGGTRNALFTALDDVESLLLKGKTGQALQKLAIVRTRVDGCGALPDTNDWIVQCDGQLAVRASLDLLVANLS